MNAPVKISVPGLARFLQADTIIPESQGVLGHDRYAYANNSPVKFNDPDGHNPLIGAGLGFIAGGAIYGITSMISGRSFNLADLEASALVGAAGGALIGTGIGASAGLATFATIGAGTSILGSQLGYSVSSGTQFNSTELVVNAGGAGAVTGALSAPPGINPVSNSLAAAAGKVLINGVSSVAQYGAVQLVNGQSILQNPNQLAAAGVIGLTAGTLDVVIPGFTGPINSSYGSFLYQPQFVTASEHFRQSLLLMAKKELVWQGSGDFVKTTGLELLSNWAQDQYNYYGIKE